MMGEGEWVDYLTNYLKEEWIHQNVKILDYFQWQWACGGGAAQFLTLNMTPKPQMKILQEFKSYLNHAI